MEQFSTAPGQAEVENESDDMGEAIVKCIFESLNIMQDTGASLNTFQDLLVFAQHMFCRGRGLQDEDQMIKSIWPHDWETARQYLLKLGYQDAREYFICLDDSHKCHWDILDKKTDTCRHCGKPGKLKYYYLALQGKVKQWVASPEMCRKMTGHWREKEHWLGRERGWHIKKRFGMVTVSVSCHGFGTQMPSGVCQQSVKRRIARIFLLEKPLKVCL